MVGLGLGVGVGSLIQYLPRDPVAAPLAASSAAPMYERRIADRAHSWHINDSVVFDPVTRRTYKGSQRMSDGAQLIDIYGTDGALQSTVVVNDNVSTAFIPDDHNAPALTLFDGQLYVGYAGHNDDSNIYMRASSDSRPENLGAVSVLPNDQSTTYVQFVELAGQLYVTGRKGLQFWKLHQLVGAAWSSVGDISQSPSQTYINLRAGGGNLRYVAWDHPTTSAEPGRGEIKLRAFLPGDPVALLQDLVTVYDPGAGKSTRVLSVAPDGSVFAFVEFTIGQTTGQTYHLLRWSGAGAYDDPAQWVREDIGGNDYAFYPSSNYVPGVALANPDGTAVWVCAADALGVTTVRYGTRAADGTWSFVDVASSGKPLARPVCDPQAMGQVWIERLETYLTFRDAEIDNYVLFTDEHIVNGDFTAPPPPVVGVRASQVLEYFDAPDLATVSWTVDLSAAQEGDLLVAAYVYRSGASSALTLDGVAFTEHANTDPAPSRAYVATLPYSVGMGDQLTLTTSSAASYQKLLFAIITPGYAVANAGVNPAYQAGDLIAGVGFSAGDPTAAHNYSSDTQVSRVQHGSNTVISFGLGVATEAGSAAVSELGPTDPLQLHLVLRPA